MAVRFGVVLLIAVLDSALSGCGGVMPSGEAVRGAIGSPFQIFSARTEPDFFDPSYPRTAIAGAFLPIASTDPVTLTAPQSWRHQARERATLHQRADGSIFLGVAPARPFAAQYSAGQSLSGGEAARLRETLLPFLVPSCQSTDISLQP